MFNKKKENNILEFEKFTFSCGAAAGRTVYEIKKIPCGVKLLNYIENNDWTYKQIIFDKTGDEKLLNKIQMNLGKIYYSKKIYNDKNNPAISDGVNYNFECVLINGNIISNKPDISYKKLNCYMEKLMKATSNKNCKIPKVQNNALEFEKFTFKCSAQSSMVTFFDIEKTEIGVHLMKYEECYDGSNKQIIIDKFENEEIFLLIQAELAELRTPQISFIKDIGSPRITEVPRYELKCILKNKNILYNPHNISYSKIYNYLESKINILGATILDFEKFTFYCQQPKIITFFVVEKNKYGVRLLKYNKQQITNDEQILVDKTENIELLKKIQVDLNDIINKAIHFSNDNIPAFTPYITTEIMDGPRYGFTYELKDGTVVYSSCFGTPLSNTFIVGFGSPLHKILDYLKDIIK